MPSACSSLHSPMRAAWLESSLGAAPPATFTSRWWQSLTHACSTASMLTGGCTPSPISVDVNHLLMPSARGSLHEPMPAAQLQDSLGAVPPASFMLVTIHPNITFPLQFSLPFMSISFLICFHNH